MFLAKINDKGLKFSSVFEDFFGPVESFFDPYGFDKKISTKANVREDEKEFLVNMEVPGVDKKDVNIDVKSGVLTISGERKETHTDKKSNWSESYYGSFSRSFTIPENVKIEDISAKQENGILSISIPKIQEENKKESPIKIEIK